MPVAPRIPTESLLDMLNCDFILATFPRRIAPLSHQPLINQEGRKERFESTESVIPRLTRVAGFELGWKMFINTALPEAAAEFLRKVDVEIVKDAAAAATS